MPIGAVIGAVAGIGSAVIGASSANKASKAQTKSANQAQALQKEMYEQTREDLEPYRSTGEQYAYSLADMFGFKTPNNPDGSTPFAQKAWENFKETPYYTVPYKEGMSAIDHSAAARGNLLSTGHLKRIGEFAGNFASRQFGSYLDRLYQLAGMGQNAAGQTASASMATGNAQAQSALAAGEAKAAGIVGTGNAISQGVSSLGENLAYLTMQPTTGYATLY